MITRLLAAALAFLAAFAPAAVLAQEAAPAPAPQPIPLGANPDPTFDLDNIWYLDLSNG